MEGTTKRGRSRSRTSAPYPRAMSVSRSRSRGAPRVVYQASAGETKYFDTSFTQTIASAGDWTGTEVPCTNYIQNDGTTLGSYTASALVPSAVGSGYGQVIGSKYKIKKLRVRGLITGSALSDQADVPIGLSVRIALVVDTRPNGAQAQGEEVFPDMGTATQNNYSFMAMGSAQGDRFRVLKDEVVILNPASAGTDGANTLSAVRTSAPFSFTWKPKVPWQVLITPSSATPTVAALANCNIFLLAHSISTGAIITGCSRCYYEG